MYVFVQFPKSRFNIWLLKELGWRNDAPMCSNVSNSGDAVDERRMRRIQEHCVKARCPRVQKLEELGIARTHAFCIYPQVQQTIYEDGGMGERTMQKKVVEVEQPIPRKAELI